MFVAPAERSAMPRVSLVAVVAVLVVVAGCNGGPGDRTPQSVEAEASHTDYCRLFPDSADPGAGAYR